MAEMPDPAVLLDLAGDKIAVLDEDGIYRHLNATVADMLGFRPDEQALEMVDDDCDEAIDVTYREPGNAGSTGGERTPRRSGGRRLDR